MVLPRLLRRLVAGPGAAAWLPCCHELFLACSAAEWRWPRLPRWRWPCGCFDGFKLLLVLLMVSAMAAEVRLIASSSMAPTLRAGDRVVAEKVSYLFWRPSVGDIVFFRVPAALQNHGFNNDVVFIKRILATPGDFIEVRQGKLLINGVVQTEHYIVGHASYTMEAMRVPAGHVFVMGDNRNNSCDSRAWGPLPVANIVGRYMMSFSRSSYQ